MISRFSPKFKSVLSKVASLRTRIPHYQGLANTVKSGQSAILAGAIATGVVIVGRELHFITPVELNAYDAFVRWRTPSEPDPRLLIVAITEADIQAQGRWPLSDESIYQLLDKLDNYQPRVIGLDIYRDIAQEPGREQLLNYLQNSDRAVSICKLSETSDDDDGDVGVAPPPNIPENRLGFSDFALDNDGVVRRTLLLGTPEPQSSCQTPYSFSLQLARHYLAPQNIHASFQNGQLYLGDKAFPQLHSRTGHYQRVDAGGYQILLEYRAPRNVARQVTLTQVLEGQIEPEWVRDRAVLIGVTAPSIDDAFYTPYSATLRQIHRMPGVTLHAQIVSQLLDVALEGRPLLWDWPEGVELLWVLVWSLSGGLLVLKIQHPFKLLGAIAIALLSLVAINWVLFLQGGRIPLVAPNLGFAIAASGVLIYTTYKTRREHLEIIHRVQAQEDNIALLKTMLEEHTDVAAIAPTVIPNQNNNNYEDATRVWKPGEQAAKASVNDTQRDSPPANRKPGHLGGRYKIMDVLGAGGFGRTYLAEDTQRPGNPQCVIKHLKPARNDIRFLQVARRLFVTEAEILELLGKHDQIPQLLAYFEEQQEFYLVEEYIKGHHLGEELPVDKRLPESQAVELLKGVLEILAFIHEHRVIHRDIKPSNIIRRESDQRLCLIDFGAVKQIQPQWEPETENITVAIGTKGYAPPEQLVGQPRLSSDLYALGMIGIQALTGIAPHQLRQDQETGGVVWRNLAAVGPELAEVIDRMVAYHFSDRFQTAADALQALKKLPPSPTVVSPILS